jgi:MFS family permease
MIAQPAWSYLLGRFHAGRILGISAFVWGVMVLVMVWSKSFSHVMVTRFFLGVFESAVTPGLSLMTGWWYTRDEIPLRQTIWYSAVGWGGMIVRVTSPANSPPLTFRVRSWLRESPPCPTTPPRDGN